MSAIISITPNTGFANGTNFTFSLDLITLGTYNTFLWDFGDGEYSRNPNPSHVYKAPGTYTVTLNTYNDDGTYVTTKTSVNVSLYLNESIYFDIVPPPTFAGHLNRFPFKVNITSSSTNPHIISLGSQFSKSYQYQNPENKWSFLRPQWRFLDLNGNQIDTIQTVDTPIKIDNVGNLSVSGNVVGVTGTAEFYFVDDMYNIDSFLQNQSYSTIIATLETSAVPAFGENTDSTTPSFANSKAVITMPHIFVPRDPDYINITENGSQQLSKIKFTNQKIPFLVNLAFSGNYPQDDFVDGNGIQLASFNEFAHYVPINSSYSINFVLSAYNLAGTPLNFTYNPSTIQFNFSDQNGFLTGGYHKGYMTSPTSAIDCYIKTTGYFPAVDIQSRFFNPILWISNPFAGMMATALYYSNSSLNPAQSDSTLGIMDKAYVKSFEMPVIQSYRDAVFFGLNQDNITYSNVMATSGYHGIYSIAALPAPTYHAWLADPDLNLIYRVNTKGDILATIDVHTQLVYNRNLFKGEYVSTKPSPTFLSVDSNQNLWVTLNDTPYALKFDNHGNFLTYADFTKTLVTPSNNLSAWWKSSTSTDGSVDNDLIRPTGIETDLNNNVWVTYSSPFSGWLNKYNSQGSLLYSHSFPASSCPQELVCDNQNNIWLVLSKDVGNNYGYLEKRDTNGNLLSAIGSFNNINHITLDNHQNIWFTYSYNWIGTIDSKTATVNTIQITGGNYSDSVPAWFDANYNADQTSLEGIACDIRNNIYVINSIENRVFVLNGDSQKITDSFLINPKGFVYTLSGALQPTQLEYNPWSKSAQAVGDWTGFRWINKYASQYFQTNSNYVNQSGTYYKVISGDSSLNYNKKTNSYFSLYYTNYYDLFKINENFDLMEQMHSLAFQPSLQESTNLFDSFLNAIFNIQTPLGHDALGTLAYEKIANFVSNQSDIDTCNVNSLYDLSELVDLNTDDYRLNYPIGIQRSMDLLSINQSRIFGQKMNDFYNFINSSSNSNFNRGVVLNSLTYTVTAGNPVILKTKSLGSYKLIQTGPLDTTGNSNVLTVSNNGKSNYTLDDLAHYMELGDDWHKYYEFYEFVPSTNDVITNNLVDWDNTNLEREKLLTFFKTNRGGQYPDSYLNWNGDFGIMEFIFTYQLYKGLGLI